MDRGDGSHVGTVGCALFTRVALLRPTLSPPRVLLATASPAGMRVYSILDQGQVDGKNLIEHDTAEPSADAAGSPKQDTK